MAYVEVAVDVPGVGGSTYTYSLPPGVEVRPGHAVWVPFGSRIRRGIVFSLSDTSEFEQTRPVDRLLNPEPLLSEWQIELARWVSRYYRCGLFLAASQMLPPGFADTLRTFVSLTGEQPSGASLGKRERRALALAGRAGQLRRELLGRRLGRGGARTVDRLVRLGFLASETVWERPRTREAREHVVTLAVTPGEAVEAAEAQRSARRGDLLRLLAESPRGLPRPELTGRFGQSAVAGLVKRGLLKVERRRAERDPLRGLHFQRSFPCDPTAAQKAAIDRVTVAMRGGRGPKRFLLYGVTGSGKTEVYLQAASACLEIGKSVIVLAPEIALTPQNLERFASRFAGRIALLHSGLTDGERFDQWWATQRGDYQIALGSRGAVFAPASNPGLIVIDEEHEWTYKQHDAAPRYHSRAVAERISRLTGAVVLAGSATPDVETYRRAERGEYELLRLPERIWAETGQGGAQDGAPGGPGSPRPHPSPLPRGEGATRARAAAALPLLPGGEGTTHGRGAAALPLFPGGEGTTHGRGAAALPPLPGGEGWGEGAVVGGGGESRHGGLPLPGRTAAGQSLVRVVDMRDELRAGNAGIFSRALIDGIGEALGADGRVILFLNRRGAASFVQCRNCGYVRRCNRCDTAMTFHRGEPADEPSALVCHYCSRRIRYTNACPDCSQIRLLPSGSGTQSVVDEVERLFPKTGVLRWDRDVARTARAHSAILREFLDGDARVLVGTQMVAKGLDIPSVTLVGVVSADTGLSIPDFRAGERAFQVLTQVAGRVGRGRDAGSAIVQTFQPDHYAVAAAAAQDFERFYEREIELRRRYANPPFTRLVKLTFGDPDSAAARNAAFELAGALRHGAAAAGLDGIDVLGPSPSYPAKVRGRTRWQIILKGTNPAELLDETHLPPGWTVDVDPVSVT